MYLLQAVVVSQSLAKRVKTSWLVNFQLERIREMEFAVLGYHAALTQIELNGMPDH